MAYRTEVLAPSAIDAAFEQAWSQLEDRALEPNAYLSPDFVLPTIAHLEPADRLRIVAVRRTGTPAALVALGVFRICPGSRHLPLPHLQGFLGVHSFLGGLLLDRDEAEPALEAFFDGLRTLVWRWQGVVLERCWSDGAQADLLRRVLDTRRLHHQAADTCQRAVLALPVDAEAHLAGLSASLRQNLGRCRRRLQEQGELHCRTLREPVSCGQVVEDFLALEHMGWKGERGSSLRADPRHEAFFRDMMARFARRGRALVTHISVAGRPVAATSNLISGQAGFAFKVGWDPAFAKFSPGMLCEAEFLRAAGHACPEVTQFDSGSSPGSYMEGIWPARRGMHTCVIAVSSAARVALGLTGALRASRALGRRWQEAASLPAAAGAALPQRESAS